MCIARIKRWWFLFGCRSRLSFTFGSSLFPFGCSCSNIWWSRRRISGFIRLFRFTANFIRFFCHFIVLFNIRFCTFLQMNYFWLYSVTLSLFPQCFIVLFKNIQRFLNYEPFCFSQSKCVSVVLDLKKILPFFKSYLRYTFLSNVFIQLSFRILSFFLFYFYLIGVLFHQFSRSFQFRIKGQLILKSPSGVYKFPKKQTKFL